MLDNIMPSNTSQTRILSHSQTLSQHYEDDNLFSEDEAGEGLIEFTNCCEIDCASEFKCQFPDTMNSAFSIFQLNIRSLKNREHFNELMHFLTEVEHEFDIIAITETWVNYIADIDFLQIPGYSSEFYMREGKTGGGVALYIRNCFNYKTKQITIDQSESLWVEMHLEKKSRPILVGVIYRPPNLDVIEFSESLHRTLSHLLQRGNRCVIAGDFNIDINDDANIEYTTMLNSIGLKSINRMPTRETPTTQTNIDHIYTNTSDLFVECGTINSTISDHKPVFAIFEDIQRKFETATEEEHYDFN